MTPVMARTKCDKSLIESAGVERGSKILETRLSLWGLATHNPGAKSTPTRRISIPRVRSTTVLQCFLCAVSGILQNLFLFRAGNNLTKQRLKQMASDSISQEYLCGGGPRGSAGSQAAETSDDNDHPRL